MSWIAVGVVTAAAIVGGGIMAAQGAHQQANAQKNMMQYQAQADAVQQQIVKQTKDANITSVNTQAALESAQLSRRQMAVKGAQAASMGAQGLSGSVTGADIAKDTFTKQEMDQSTLMYNANVKAWDLTNKANAQLWGLGSEQEQYTIGAENASTAGKIAVAGSYFNTASQLGSEALMFKGGGGPKTGTT